MNKDRPWVGASEFWKWLWTSKTPNVNEVLEVLEKEGNCTDG